MNRLFIIMSTFIIIISNIIIGCGHDTGNNQSGSSFDINNVLSLQYQSALKKSAVVCTKSVVGVDIDFGCMYKSGNYYLIPSNNSEYDLTDIKITSSNPAFEVSPSSINVIGAPNKNSSVIPMIRVAVSHGSELNNLSIPDPLPEGDAVTTITITGIVNGEPFSQEYTIGGWAETMNVVRRNDSLFLDGPIYIEDSLVYEVPIYDSTYVDMYSNKVLPMRYYSDANQFYIVLYTDTFKPVAVYEKMDGIFTTNLPEYKQDIIHITTIPVH